jgi:hypothetical protein
MNCLFILNLFLIVILSDSGNAKVSEAPILRGVTIRVTIFKKFKIN